MQVLVTNGRSLVTWTIYVAFFRFFAGVEKEITYGSIGKKERERTAKQSLESFNLLLRYLSDFQFFM
jgi:hypothetical protein